VTKGPAEQSRRAFFTGNTMIPMKCLKYTSYAGKRLRPGDYFEARGESDARVLAAIRTAERCARPAPAPTADTYKTRVMTASAPAPARPSAGIFSPGEISDLSPVRSVGLDDMDAEQLHALARQRGVKVHHLAGARKVRQALLDAQEVE